MRTCNSMMSVESHKIERVFFNFHNKLCHLGLRFTGPRVRSIIEHLVLFVAVLGFCILLLCHRTFVYRGGFIKSEAVSLNGWNVPSMCLGSIKGFQYGIDVTHIVIVDSNELTDESYVFNQTQNNLRCDFESQSQSDPVPDMSETCSQNPINMNEPGILSISHSFSDYKGFLFLEPSSLIQRNITSQCAFISTRDKACFSDDPILQYIGRSSEGILDTIALNWILGAKNGTNGFIYHHKTSDLIELEGYLGEYTFRWPTLSSPSSYINQDSHDFSSKPDSNLLQNQYHSHQHKNQQAPHYNHVQNEATTNQNLIPTSRWHHNYLIFKGGVLLSTIFLFFLTTTLVSFTLRETQDRMLVFTVQLTLYIRRGIPYANLILTHIIENMVFVPIMIGTIFFLMDCFYNNDRLLAFMILSAVWICEVFSAVSMRTIQSSIYFPQVFFAYFTLFHIYYFSCPFGFTYAALLSAVLLQLHSMLFFWNRYELPAILSGQVSSDNPRMVHFAQPLVQTLVSSPPSPGNRSSAVVGASMPSNRTLRRLGSGTSHPSMSHLGRLGLPPATYRRE